MQKLRIPLDQISTGLAIELFAIIPNTIFEISDALENNEAKYQLLEGCYYQYKLTEGYFFERSEVVEVSNFHISEGRLSPNTYVGTLSLPILKKGLVEGHLQLEVQSLKTSYRKDYRFMLESITKHATDLVLQTNSPVNQTLEVDYNTDSKTLYQRFCFVRSIIDTDEFEVAINQITKAPVTSWKTKTESKDVRSLKRLNSRDVRNLIHSQNRVNLPTEHPLRVNGINSIALKIPTSIKEETTDTPENRFVKYVLETFLSFCEEIQLKSKANSRLHKEAELISNKLTSWLQHNLFKVVSKPTTIKLNSPVLQKKSGYREVLKAWLMFDLAAKLAWEGGEDVYSAGSKNVARLYEYWLFFKLLEAVKETFEINSEEYKKLISPTADTLGLNLKEGKQIALFGTYISEERQLSIEFAYNKNFSSSSKLSAEGSWTLQMKPDYTLSIWPKVLSKASAEEQEQIVNIHFDAKYKVKNKEDNLNFKEDDLIKMHAYKDAIKRTAGAYILYPGLNNEPTIYKGFHEILPGLGAFAIRPSEDHSGIEHLTRFIIKVKNHFLNRASQREHISTKTYDITKNGPSTSFNEPIPEYFSGQKLIPSETFVLVGYCKSNAHLEWINDRLLYNFRMNNNRGALKLTSETLNAKYLLLHMSGDKSSSKIYKIQRPEYRVTSKQTLLRLEYPNPRQKDYLVVKLEFCTDKEFENISWNFKGLRAYKSGRASAIPFTVSLPDLMAVKL